MCIGTPMRVLSCEGGLAHCEGRGRRQRLSMMLVGEQPPGTWVLAFGEAAVRVLSAEDAARTDDALDALEAALAGEERFEAYFADLVEREPQLPEHLRTPRS